MADVEIIHEETVYTSPRGTSRLDKVTYSNGVVEYGAWISEGAHSVELLNVASRVPLLSPSGVSYECVHAVGDDGLAGMLFREGDK